MSSVLIPGSKTVSPSVERRLTCCRSLAVWRMAPERQLHLHPTVSSTSSAWQTWAIKQTYNRHKRLTLAILFSRKLQGSVLKQIYFLRSPDEAEVYDNPTIWRSPSRTPPLTDPHWRQRRRLAFKKAFPLSTSSIHHRQLSHQELDDIAGLRPVAAKVRVLAEQNGQGEGRHSQTTATTRPPPRLALQALAQTLQLLRDPGDRLEEGWLVYTAYLGAFHRWRVGAVVREIALDLDSFSC